VPPHVLEEGGQIDFLVGAPAKHAARLLAHDREHRLVIEHRVVEPVPGVDRARPGGDQANAEPAAELGMRARHQRGAFPWRACTKSICLRARRSALVSPLMPSPGYP